MNLRELSLPRGWYPRESGAISEFLAPFSNTARSASAIAAIAPHASWHYSGVPAAMAVSSLDRDAETLAVIGGHLPLGAPVLLAAEDGVKTPLGVMQIDRELRDDFIERIQAEFNPACADTFEDNTVEVLLPMARYFFPRAALLWVRLPAELSSRRAGELLAESAACLKRRVAVLASTDLTHYGDNYGYSPQGRGKAALDWVKNVNDAAFIAAILANDPARALKLAEESFAACSAGAVLGAMGFAGSLGRAKPRLLDYRTSADGNAAGETPDSFVGYAAVAFE